MIKEFFEIVELFETIVIVGHIFPDPDSYGSSIGLREILRLKYPNKKVLSAGQGYKKLFPLLGPPDIIDEKIISESLLIMVDISNNERIECKELLKAKGIIKIDHHIEDYEFPGFKIMNTEASSVCQMIAEMVMAQSLKMNIRAATALFAGLVTDTGRFMYALDRNSFAVANFLLGHGIPYKELYSILYTEDIRRNELVKVVYEKYRITKAGLGYFIANSTILEQLRLDSAYVLNEINLLANIIGIDMWMFLVELPNGIFKAELRSTSIDVHQIATRYGGGGHINASGFVISMDKISPLIKEINKYLITIKKNSYRKELKEAISAAFIAKDKIMAVYQKEFVVVNKSDDSPVTEADQQADKAIINHLSKIFPSHGFLTEESEDNSSRLEKEFVWIVDPVDGTKDFVSRNGEFTTSIALSRNGEIVVGVVMVPVTGEYYYAVKDYGAFYCNGKTTKRIHVNNKRKNLTVLLSNFHTKQAELDLVEKYSKVIKYIVKKGSCLKPCYIAQGKAELTYRIGGGTKEWDIAASLLIVQEAGGVFMEPDGSKIVFNRKDVYNRNGYIVANSYLNILL